MQGVKKVVTISLIFTLTGCATIIHDGRQDIGVTSNPSGAIVRVAGMATTTPGIINLDRKQTHYVLVFENEGYRPVELRLRRTLSGWIFANIFFFFYAPIGIVIDFASGAAYKLTPDQINVAFDKQKISFLKDKAE